MIKIVDAQQYHPIDMSFHQGAVVYIIDSPVLTVCYTPPEPYDYTARIGICDSHGLAFIARSKPSVPPLCLVEDLLEARPDAMVTRAGQRYQCDIFATTPDLPRAVCVDPRVLMAHILTWWAFPHGKDEYDDFVQALNPLPSIEGAREWMERNRLGGANAFQQDGYAGYYLEPGMKLPYIPPKVLECYPRFRYNDGKLPFKPCPWDPNYGKE